MGHTRTKLSLVEFLVILLTTTMGIGGKYMNICLEVLDLPGVKYSIGYKFLKVLDYKIGPTMSHMDY